MIHSSSVGDIGPHVGLAPVEIEHHIGHPLARPVIGELAAAAGLVHRKTRFDEVLRLRAGSGGVERWVLEQPDQLGRCARGDRRRPLVHHCECCRVADRTIADPPLHRRAAGGGHQRQSSVGTVVNHSFTIPW